MNQDFCNFSEMINTCKLKKCELSLLKKTIHIIIFNFENFAFFYVKLGSDDCPRVDKTTKPLATLYTKWKNPHQSVSYPPMGIGPIGASFWCRDALPNQSVRNLETSSAVVEFPPQYHNQYNNPQKYIKQLFIYIISSLTGLTSQHYITVVVVVVFIFNTVYKQSV